MPALSVIRFSAAQSSDNGTIGLTPPLSGISAFSAFTGFTAISDHAASSVTGDLGQKTLRIKAHIGHKRSRTPGPSELDW